MTKRKIVIVIAAVLLCIAAAAGITVFAIQKSGIAFKLGEDTEKVWLDRYEEKNITVESGDPKKLKWKSSDVKVVTVEEGRLSAQGVGTATVTVSSGFKKETIQVQVSDSGSLPSISCEDFDAYQDAEIPIPAQIKYNGEVTDITVSYTADIERSTIAECKDGNIRGIALGETGAVIKAEYKGLQLERKVNITVKENSLVEFSAAEVTIYNAKNNAKWNSTVLSPMVIKNAKKLENPEVTYEILEGEDCVTIDGATVTATKDGTAKVKASYQDKDIQVAAEITVNVLPNWVSTTFVGAGAADDKWEAATGTVGGRGAEGTDMMEYRSGKRSSGTSCWDHRVLSVDSSTKLVDLYRKGYRYFTYEMYYCTDASFYLGVVSGDPGWVAVNELFRRDYVKILADENGDGKLEATNCLQKNKWITVSFDIMKLIEKWPTLKAGFYFTLDDDTTSSYVMNIRYYMDDTFMPADTHVYTDKGDYVETSEDEFIVAFPYAKEITADEVPKYAPYSKKVGGRTDVYRYQANYNSTWFNNLVIWSSMEANYNNGMLNLSKLGRYLTFDIYIEEAKQIKLSINHEGSKATITLGKTDLSMFSKWLKVFKDGKLQYTIDKGGWYTVSVGYMDGVDLESYKSTIYLSAASKGDVFYIDNVRYYKNADFLPTEYSGVQPPEGLETIHPDVSLERVTSGAFKGTTKLISKNPAETWDDHTAGVRFTNVTSNNGENSGLGVEEFFDSGYKYIKMDFYLAENTKGISWLSWSAYHTAQKDYESPKARQEGKLLIGDLNLNTLLFDAETKKYANNLQANKWYTVFIPVEYDYELPPTWSIIEFRVMGGSEENPAVAYIKNLEYTKKAYSYKPSDIIPQPEVSLTIEKRYGAWDMGYDVLDIRTACSGPIKLIINNDKANPVEIATTQSGNVYKAIYSLDQVLDRMILGENSLTVESSDGASTTITYENKGFLFVRDPKGELTYTTDNGETVLKYKENYEEDEENEWVGFGSAFVSTKSNHAGGFDLKGVKYMTMQVKLLKGDGFSIFYDLRDTEKKAGYGIHRIDTAIKVGQRSSFLTDNGKIGTLELNKWVTVIIPLFYTDENPNDIYRNFSIQPRGYGSEMLIKNIGYGTETSEAGVFDVSVIYGDYDRTDSLQVVVPNQVKTELIINEDTENPVELSLTKSVTGYEVNYNIAKIANRLKMGKNLLTVRTADGKSLTVTYENKFFLYAADEGGKVEYIAEDGVTLLKYTKGNGWQGLGSGYISTQTPWNGGFIADGVKYITMEVKLVSGSGLNIFYDISDQEVQAGNGAHKISKTIKIGENSIYLVKDGYRTTLQKDEWVTVMIPLWSVQNVDQYRQFYIRPTGDGEKAMLVRNVAFRTDDYTEPVYDPNMPVLREAKIESAKSTDYLKVVVAENMKTELIINNDTENAIELSLTADSVGYEATYDISQIINKLKLGDNQLTVRTANGNTENVTYSNTGFLYARNGDNGAGGTLTVETIDGENVLKFVHNASEPWTGLSSKYVVAGTGQGNYAADGVKYIRMKIKIASAGSAATVLKWCDLTFSPDARKNELTLNAGMAGDANGTISLDTALAADQWITVTYELDALKRLYGLSSSHPGYSQFYFRAGAGQTFYVKDIQYLQDLGTAVQTTFVSAERGLGTVARVIGKQVNDDRNTLTMCLVK